MGSHSQQNFGLAAFSFATNSIVKQFIDYHQRVFPFQIYSINCATLKFGGISTNICIYSEHASASMILTFSVHTNFSISFLYPPLFVHISPFFCISVQILYNST